MQSGTRDIPNLCPDDALQHSQNGARKCVKPHIPKKRGAVICGPKHHTDTQTRVYICILYVSIYIYIVVYVCIYIYICFLDDFWRQPPPHTQAVKNPFLQSSSQKVGSPKMNNTKLAERSHDMNEVSLRVHFVCVNLQPPSNKFHARPGSDSRYVQKAMYTQFPT